MSDSDSSNSNSNSDQNQIIENMLMQYGLGIKQEIERAETEIQTLEHNLNASKVRLKMNQDRLQAIETHLKTLKPTPPRNQ